ncbi:MAG: DUF5686 and carboxypeptidase regulatory-like domain-containing protein [Bacteroidales bacterium]|nr:DUF5686 and carboxypeptidase regulatory-like domain-containing protein [Bacteroidales bacterium]
MRKIILTVFISFFGIYSFSQCIKGKITNNSGNPIPYATIYATGISKGTTSNIEGNYKLDLPKGNHKITIRYLGYKTRELNVSCSDSTQTIDIILEEQLYKIPEVRILASGEDPAYSIMRKAVAMSYYYLNQVEEYNCRVYLKGSGKFESIPRLMKKTLKKEGIEEGKAMVMENISDLHFELPDIIEENTISMRSTMDDNEVSPMGYITISLYNDIDGVISPLSRDAFTYYKFQLDASFYDQDYLVHKIKVIPRRQGYDLYSGYIYIVEGFWHLHSAELQLEQKMFKVKWNQVYSPVNDEVWMPISHNFDIDAGAMGFEVVFKYIASVSDYKVKLNSNIDHSLYRNMLAESKEYINEINELSRGQQNEIQELVQKEDLSKKESRKLKKLVRKDVEKSVSKEKDLELKDNNNSIEDSAMLRSVFYWDSIRPIPLTVDEFDSYKDKDSIQLRMETDSTFKDSLERDDKRFKWRKLLMGGSYNYDGGHQFRYGGLVDLGHINFNTVDGLKYGMEFSYTYRSDSSGKYFRIRQNADYAFARERMTSYLSMYYRYNGLKRASVNLSGGRKTSDFDSKTGITENLNMLTTLFMKENYLKLYQKDYISIGHNIDIANGLNIYTGFEYAQRHELVNHSDFYFYDPFKTDFTSNIPPTDNFNTDLVKDHNASIFSVDISYTPEYYYRIREGVKRMSYSNYPTFKMSYQKGIKNLFDSDVDFDRLEVSVRQGLRIRRIGGFNYKLTAGSFLNSNDLFFADYKHFGTNTPFLIGSSERNIFRLPDYYDYSSDKSYFEGHAKLESDRILLKRLPVLNKTLMREAIYINYLATTGNKPYYEFGYGLNQIFLMFNVEIFAGFKGTVHEYTGIKIGIPFVGRSGTSITVGG